MAADITTTLASWSSTAASNQPDYSDAVGPNNLADNLRVVQSVVRDAVAGDGTIASAATTDLSTVNASYINVTGSTGPITALGTLSAGIVKILKFASTPTLTHNATSLILPGAANITAVAGDTACFRSEGSGNWRCLWYQKTNGTLVIASGKTATFNATTTFSGVDGKTLTVNNSLTLAGTDGTTMTFPGTSASIARTDAAQSFTGLQTFSTGITSTAASNTLGSATVSGTWTGSGSPTFTSMGSWSGTSGTFSGQMLVGGATDPGWGGSAKIVGVGSNLSALSAGTGGDTTLNSNAYYNGSAWKYTSTAASGQYIVLNNTHTFNVAASGTAGNTITWTTGVTIGAGGAVTFPSISTTASAANAFLDNASGNNLLRSTSSLRYKTALEDLTLDEARNIALGRHAFSYTSTSDADNKDTRWIGYAAEEVAQVDKRFATFDGEGLPNWVQYERFVVPHGVILGDHEARLKALEEKIQ